MACPAVAFRLLPPAEVGGHAIREDVGALPLLPSSLRPPVPADQRIFAWRGVNTPPSTTLSHPLLEHLAREASHASLRAGTQSSYGSGLRKFHVFCDAFSIPESARLLASFELLHSFCLWAVADPTTSDVSLAGDGHWQQAWVGSSGRWDIEKRVDRLVRTLGQRKFRW